MKTPARPIFCASHSVSLHQTFTLPHVISCRNCVERREWWKEEEDREWQRENAEQVGSTEMCVTCILELLGANHVSDTLYEYSDHSLLWATSRGYGTVWQCGRSVMIWRGLEEAVMVLPKHYQSIFSRDWRKCRKRSVKITGVPTEIRTNRLPNMNLGRCLYTTLFRGGCSAGGWPHRLVIIFLSSYSCEILK
jgi:hypothetical protein